MIKKIFVGIVIAVVFGLLVLGAVNRTLAKNVENEPLALSENNGTGAGGNNANGTGNGGAGNGSTNDGSAGNNGAGNQNDSAPGNPDDCADEEGEGYGNPDGSGEGIPAQDGSGYKGGGNGNAGSGQNNGANANSGNGTPSGEGEAEVNAWIILEGTVIAMEDDLWTITLTDGTTLEIEGRALSFAEESGFTTDLNHTLSLTGFYENGDFEVGAIDDLTSGENVLLRDENGRPLWAGGGRGGSH